VISLPFLLPPSRSSQFRTGPDGPEGWFLTVGAPGGSFEIVLWPHAPATGWRYPFGIRIEAVDPDGSRISLRQRARREG